MDFSYLLPKNLSLLILFHLGKEDVHSLLKCSFLSKKLKDLVCNELLWRWLSDSMFRQETEAQQSKKSSAFAYKSWFLKRIGEERALKKEPYSIVELLCHRVSPSHFFR